jgi:hypothetical protein
MAFFIVCLFEDGGADQLMEPGHYLYFGLGNLINLGGILPSPLEVLLFLTVTIWLAQALARRRLDFRGGTLRWQMALFGLALLFGLLRGIAGHAQLSFIMWELRFLVYMVACYFLATNTIRSKSHVRQLLLLGMLAMTLFGLEATFRKVALIDTGLMVVPMEFAYSHESVIFFGALLLLVVAQQAFGAPAWLRWLGLVALGICGFALLASERRAGQIAVIVAFLAASLVFLRANRKAFFLISVPVILAFSLYLPVFWNNSSTFGQPARAVRSLFRPDPRDASSNLYRDMEKLNIYTTIRAGTNALFGVGFGRPFIVVVQLVDVSYWPLWMYETHNNIMWIWMKVGPVGFIIFWTLMGSGLMRASYLTRTLRTREGQVFGLFALAGIVITLVFCYVDLGFTGPRVPVFLGTLLGTLGVLERHYD